MIMLIPDVIVRIANPNFLEHEMYLFQFCSVFFIEIIK